MTLQAVLNTPPQSISAFPAHIDPVRFEQRGGATPEL
jgi:hypothetical protein